MSALWTVFSEYCSITKPAINHIALSPRRALPLAVPAHRTASIGLCRSLVGLSERDIGAIVNPASCFGIGDWKKGFSANCQSGSFLFVSLAFSAAACDALSAERGDALHTNRDIRRRLIFGQDAHRPHPALCQKQIYIWSLDSLHFNLSSHAFSEIFFLSFSELKSQSSVWDICSFCCIFFLVEGFCSEEDKQPYPPLSLQRESPKGKVKTDVFIHSHVEAFGLLLLTLVHWVFVLIYIYLYIFNQISRNCTLREEYRDIWLQKREKKKQA